MPALFLDDGTQLTQSEAIARYISRNYKGTNGEDLYPTRDADTCYEIDLILKDVAVINYKLSNFIIPFYPGYKNKDQLFIEFICKLLPDYLEKIEARLAAHKDKFILGKDITLADFSMATPFFKLSHNDGFEYSHIVDSVISKYPKSRAWIQNFYSINKESLTKFVRPM